MNWIFDFFFFKCRQNFELKLGIGNREVEITELLRLIRLKPKRLEDETKSSHKQERACNKLDHKNNRNKENDELLNILTRQSAIYSNEAGWTHRMQHCKKMADKLFIAYLYRLNDLLV